MSDPPRDVAFPVSTGTTIDVAPKKKTHFFSQVASPTGGSHLSLRACAFLREFTTDKLPCCQGRRQVSRLTSSIFPFHKKPLIALDTLVWSQSGILTTVAVYQRPEALSVLIIIDLPLETALTTTYPPTQDRTRFSVTAISLQLSQPFLFVDMEPGPQATNLNNPRPQAWIGV